MVRWKIVAPAHNGQVFCESRDAPHEEAKNKADVTKMTPHARYSWLYAPDVQRMCHFVVSHQAHRGLNCWIELRSHDWENEAKDNHWLCIETHFRPQIKNPKNWILRKLIKNVLDLCYAACQPSNLPY